ncbi:dynamin family protein [Roseibacterium sp. SDUM158017]|uniref:dynamin family protein n=1 Tax=Roseicyclus salinarum TaxID=3036773 RepID=UPI0024156EBE|nr:dynamin family protein [Roseibacterium sp. SDUM158017]MDG4647766.1 dynamin family protein [Roseibacterium sp. SDUM158017]
MNIATSQIEDKNMKQDRTLAAAVVAPPSNERLMATAYRGLSPLVHDLRIVDEALENLLKVGDAEAEPAIRDLRRQLRAFEPSVTMIGQVKAGKTSLVNAMVGRPNLLPADINPWTSVITSLHVSPRIRESAQHAKFRFFSDEEWQNLLSRGGRIGELARRAGAESELETVRAQLEAMREKSRQRLGRSFELLLGQEHDYGYVDPELVERYVCLGDEVDPGTEPDHGQGRFADITKAAELYLSQRGLVWPLCVRDTPGVNDTFLVREQITVNAIRSSRVCVVVLSAHQALSTVDMALIRMIANIRSRDVIIFVNRVDELADPAREIPEIRESIRATLKAQNGPVDAKILFGSAFWATNALAGELHELGKGSAEALLNLAEHEVRRGLKEASAEETIWTLSGLPALGRAISERIIEGEGRDMVEHLARAARNIAGGLAASRSLAAERVTGAETRTVAKEALAEEIDAIARDAEAELDRELDNLLAALDARLDGARRTFLQRATGSLINHLEARGEQQVWTYDPTGLRVLLRSGYQVFTAKAGKVSGSVYQNAATALEGLFRGTFDLPAHAFALEPPPVPDAPPPVTLGQTIALDIKGNWWTRWWRRRRSYEAFADEFSGMIDAEIAPMIEALRTDHADVFKAAAAKELRSFLAAQRTSLLAMAGQTEERLEELRGRMSKDAATREKSLTHAQHLLSGMGQHEQKDRQRHDA